MIKAVCISNLKGTVESRIELPPCGVLTGPNGSGKSTTLQAIKLFIDGKLSEANVSGTSDIFKLARSGQNSLSVGLEMSGGFMGSRNYERVTSRDPGTGEQTEKVSQDITIFPANSERKLSEKEARIRQECGLDPVSVDVSEFLKLSDNKRRDFFYNLSGGAQELTVERINEALDYGKATIGAAADNQYDALAGQIIERWNGNLNAILEWLSNQSKAAKQNANSAKATARYMATLKAKKQTVAGELSQLKADKARLEARKDELNGEVSKQAGLVSAINEREKLIGFLTEKIEKLKKPEATAELLASLELKRDELKTSIEAAKAEMEAEGKKLSEASAKALGFYEIAGQGVEARNNTLQSLESRADALDKVKDMLSILCDTCRAAFKKQMDTVSKTELSLARKALVNAKDSYSAANQLVKQTSEALREYVREKDLALSRLERDYADAVRECESTRKSIDAQVQGLTDTEKALAEIKESRLEEPLPVEHLQNELDGIKARLGELDIQQEAKRKEEHDLQVQLDAIAEAEESETKVYCLKKLVALLGPAGLKGELVKETLEPVKAQVQKHLEFFGYQDCSFDFSLTDARGNETFDLGWRRDSAYVLFDSLSTGQQAVLLISLVATIVSRSSSPLRACFFDNLECISADHEVALYRGLPQLAAACGLHNLIVATSKSLPAELPAGLSVINFPLNGGN
jgi:DNA repair exonuclease SbcCD ATPase subunit